MTKLKLANSGDEELVARGYLRPDEVRRTEVDALVDTGATGLAVPADIVEGLGLRELRRVEIGLADGSKRLVPIVTGVLIEIVGRGMVCDAFVLPAGSTPLIGQIQLEWLDLVVDPKSRDVTVNPASPDMPSLDLLHVA
jgi:clan AA aspartic protease